MIIERANHEDFSSLKNLWSEVFSEDPVFLEHFFSTRFASEHIFVARKDGIIVSALHALPAQYLQNDAVHSCSFIVGAATYASHRKQGIMGALLAATQQAYNHPVTLFPAVRPFYEANGYFTTSSVLSFPLEGFDCSSAASIPIKVDHLDRLYRTEHARHGCLLRDRKAWDFLTDGYQTLCVQNGYAFISGGKAVEACASDETAAAELLALLASNAVTEVHTLENSFLARLLDRKKAVPIPMGMGTDTSMQGVYIAEQY
ncbi:MAG: GNAT family N-acetyltransferase [Spirochaetia bacterium]|nr:GNAT family N-acetyltransferase [Spirochaetia bacterium]